jgi:hypothetical protein
MTGARARAIAATAIADDQLGQLSQARRTTVIALLSLYSQSESDAQLQALLHATHPERRRSGEDWVALISDWTHGLFTRAASHRWVRVLVIVVLIVQVALSLADVGYVIVAQWLTNIDSTALSASDLADFASSALQSTLMAIGLILCTRHDWSTGLRTIRMGLFIALMFTTPMEFADQQLHALTDFAFAAIMFAIVGAAEEATRRGEIAPNSMVAAVDRQ